MTYFDNGPADLFYVEGVGTCFRSASDESMAADYDPMGYSSAPRIVRPYVAPTPRPCVIHWQSGYCDTHREFDRSARCPRVNVVDIDDYPYAAENLGRLTHGTDSPESAIVAS